MVRPSQKIKKHGVTLAFKLAFSWVTPMIPRKGDIQGFNGYTGPMDPRVPWKHADPTILWIQRIQGAHGYMGPVLPRIQGIKGSHGSKVPMDPRLQWIQWDSMDPRIT